MLLRVFELDEPLRYLFDVESMICIVFEKSQMLLLLFFFYSVRKEHRIDIFYLSLFYTTNI